MIWSDLRSDQSGFPGRTWDRGTDGQLFLDIQQQLCCKKRVPQWCYEVTVKQIVLSTSTVFNERLKSPERPLQAAESITATTCTNVTKYIYSITALKYKYEALVLQYLFSCILILVPQFRLRHFLQIDFCISHMRSCWNSIFCYEWNSDKLIGRLTEH